MQVTDKIVNWAQERNLIQGSTPEKQFIKLVEELGELAEGMAKRRPGQIIDSIGDMGVVLTILAAQLGTSFEACLTVAYDEIKLRKGRMVDGVFIKEGD
ncbi:MAG: NTP-PPase_u3 [Podoviridae sp. ctbj_2]|nr:MAG: NTP-PPase_u3 [Podoviridae sp. ctbj_2]